MTIAHQAQDLRIDCASTDHIAHQLADPALPVQPTPGGEYPMVHADKDDVELDGFGLVKLDILGVRMQSAMAHAVTEIEQATGRHIDLDDPKQGPREAYGRPTATPWSPQGVARSCRAGDVSTVLDSNLRSDGSELS